MTRSEVHIVRSMFEAFARRDVQSTLGGAHPEIELSAPATAELAGREGPYRGHQGLLDYFADVDAVWDELTVEPQDYRAVPGAVVIFGRVRARHGDELFDGGVIWTWRVSDGLVSSGSVFVTPATSASSGLGASAGEAST